MAKKKNSFFNRLKNTLVVYALLAAIGYGFYHELWGKYVYKITAYCDCPICINIPKYQQDDQFASGRRIYWGGVAADPSVPFRTKVELVAFWPQDWMAIKGQLRGRKNYVVEDRGGAIKGRDLDIFIPQEMGGHKAALQWGVRRMRVKFDGAWAT